MGYGEFGGNGSVVWQVHHGNGHAGAGGPQGGWGHDKEPPKGEGGRFTVVVNGVQVANLDVDTGRILVLWGRTTLADVPDGNKNVAMVHPSPSNKP